jgi:uncharacterized protein YqiB (DUF1249 family)
VAAIEQGINGKEVKTRYCPDLVSDGAECDANYIRLCRLMPKMADNNKVAFGVASKHHESARISMEVIEQCRYTTILAMYFSDMSALAVNQWVGLRAMQIRVYHDLKTAEVVSCDQVRRFKSRYEYPNEGMQHPDEKSQVNHFLGEILSHCLANGHAVDWQFQHGRELQITR